MPKNIVIAKLDIDTQALLDSTKKISAEIEKLKEAQQKLIDKGKESSEQFVANEAALKSLIAAHKAQTAALSAQTTEDGKLVSVKKAVKEATDQVNQSENDYLANNQRLIALKKQLNSTDDDYEKRLAAINGKLLENNNWLNENGSAHAKLVTTMDDYKQKVTDSFNEINIFNGGLSGLISRAQEAGGVGPLVKGAFEGMGSGIVGMTKAAWGFVANPIGAILTAIVVAVQLGMAVFKDFTPIVEKVEQVMAAVGAVAETVKNAFIGLFTSGDSAGEFFSNITTGAAEAAGEAMKLKEAQQQLQKEMELQEIINQKVKNQMDELTRRSQNMTLTEGQRADAVKKLAKLEEDAHNAKVTQAEKAYNIAVSAAANGANLTKEEEARLQREGFAYLQKLQKVKQFSDEEVDALKNAHLKKLEMENETIARNQKLDAQKQRQRDEEQRQAEESNRKAEEQQDKTLKRHKDRLSLFEAESNAKQKTLQEQLKFEDDYAQKSIDILRLELKSKKISLEEFNAKVIEKETERNRNKLNAAAEYGEAALNLWKEQHKTLLKNGVVLTEALITEEKNRLDELYKMQQKQLELETGLNAKTVQDKIDKHEALTTAEMNFQTEQLRLTNEHYEKIADVNTAYADAERQRTLDRRNKEADERIEKYEADKAKATSEYETQKLDDQLRNDEKKALEDARFQDGEISLTQYNARIKSINDEAAAAEKKREQDLADFKTEQQSKLMGDMATILGRESKAGKAFSIAQATIDTYLGAQKAYLSQLTLDPTAPVRAAIAAGTAVAMGLRNIQKIAGVKDPKFEKGGLMSIGGKRHSAGGTLFTGSDGTRFEAEQGELIGVMNRNASRHFMAFNNAFPSDGASVPNYFAGGGIVSREIAQQHLNTDELALKIAEANRTLPPPVVAVQDILTEANSYVRVRDAANF